MTGRDKTHNNGKAELGAGKQHRGRFGVQAVQNKALTPRGIERLRFDACAHLCLRRTGQRQIPGGRTRMNAQFQGTEFPNVSPVPRRGNAGTTRGWVSGQARTARARGGTGCRGKRGVFCLGGGGGARAGEGLPLSCRALT